MSGTDVDGVLADLDAALRVRGRDRRRIVAECRDHLLDSSAEHGEAEAVRRFGDPVALARDFDLEAARRRSLHAAIVSLGAVGVLAWSAWTVVDAASPAKAAVVGWAVIFFASAQWAAWCAGTALLRAVAMRRGDASPGEVRLLCRRSVLAVAFALVTEVAAAGAVTGQASVVALLAGPVAAGLAVVSIAHARRPLPPGSAAADPSIARAPVLLGRARRALGAVGPAPLLVVAVYAAFARDELDGGSTTSALVAAAVEAGIVLAAVVVIAPVIGVRVRRVAR